MTIIIMENIKAYIKKRKDIDMIIGINIIEEAIITKEKSVLCAEMRIHIDDVGTMIVIIFSATAGFMK